MIRILNTANFSSCGLGQIELPYEEYIEETNAVAKFSTFTTDGEQNLRTFIRFLVDNNLYSKMKYLMIPNVATVKEEAIQNIVLNTQSLPTCNGTIVNGGYLCENQKIVSLTDYVKPLTDNKTFSLGMLREEGSISKSEQYFKIHSNTSPSSIGGDGNSTTIYPFDTSTSFYYMGTICEVGYFGFNTIDITKNTFRTNTTSQTLPYSQLNMGSATAQGNYRATPSKSIKFMFLSDPLTQDELFALKNKAVELFY